MPQGSILGPVLFNIFTNDLFYVIVKAKLFNYADDNTLNAIGENPEKVREVLAADAERALKWFEINLMKANPEKFQCIISNQHNLETLPALVVMNVEIQVSLYVNLLGVLIDNRLTFNDHVDSVVRKTSRQVNALCRLGRYLSTERKLTVVKSFILCNFTYCSAAWHFFAGE